MRLCGFEAGLDRPLFLIAGPCVIESESLALESAARLKEITGRLGVPFIYKSSFDKANRSSGASYRGPGREEGLRVLERVRREVGVPVLTDVHEDTPLDEVAAVADVQFRDYEMPANSDSNFWTYHEARGQLADIAAYKRYIARMRELGWEAVAGDALMMNAYLAAERSTWAKLIKDIGLTADF